MKPILKNRLSCRISRPLLISVAVIFVIIFAANILTPLCVDDFAYLYNFSTKERITSPLDIISSMAGHAVKMNGRLTAHAIVQLVLLLPDAVFDAINSAFFVLIIYLIFKTADNEKSSKTAFDILFFASIFGAVWIFCPAFGEVTFWLTGSVNYLWFIAFSLLYLTPFIKYLKNGTSFGKLSAQILYAVSAFFVGAYLENGSAAVIGMSALFLIASAAAKKRRPRPYMIFSVISSCLGYISILLSPAEFQNKSGTGASLKILRENFINALDVYADFAPLIILFAVLFSLTLYFRKDISAILTSVIFMLGSLAANFIIIFASYYPERCAYCVAVFIIIADAVLIKELAEGNMNALFTALFAVTLVFALYWMIIGANDIYVTGVEMLRAEKILSSASASGASEASVPYIYSQTKYTAIHSLKYIDVYDASSWPNYSMARYYGLEKVFGTP